MEQPDARGGAPSTCPLLCDGHRFDEAMEDYDAIIRHHRKTRVITVKLFLDKSDCTSAEADFNAMKAIDPICRRSCTSRHFRLDDNREAARDTPTVETAPDPNPIFGMNRAECYLNTGSIRAAADLQAAEFTKDNPTTTCCGRLRLSSYREAVK